jgi:hypothetical protein
VREQVDLHPAIEPVAWLLGDWRGEGRGCYPTVADFSYTEEQHWSHDGRPLLAYHQESWAGDDGRPLHREAGYLRVVGDRIELVVAHTAGIVEIATGGAGSPLVLSTTILVSTATAKVVDALERSLVRQGDVLRSTVAMAFAGHPLQVHLDATLLPAGR